MYSTIIENLARLSSLRPIQPRIVPMGPHISNLKDNKNIVSNSARRLEVIHIPLVVSKVNKGISACRFCGTALIASLKIKSRTLEKLFQLY